MTFLQLEALSPEEKALAAKALNAKYQVISNLAYRTNYANKKKGVTDLLDTLLDKVLVLDHGVAGLEDAKAALDAVKKDK